MLQGKRFLNSAKLSKVVQTLESKLALSRPLRFLARTEIVPAFDDEIVGRYTGQIYAADIIADDQEAATYEAGKIELVATAIPNLKVGARISQAMLNKMLEMDSRASLPAEDNAMENFENRQADSLVQGVRQRMNALICAMHLDEITYDRLGIKLNGTWGMPADLKVTVVTPWTSTSSTPISDILALKTHAQDTYGQIYNRITMSLTAFMYIVKTTEFKNLATALYRTAVGASAVNTGNQVLMQNYLGELLGMTVEIEDATYFERRGRNKIRRRVMPVNRVLLSNTDDDNNGMVMDFANGIVTESVVASLTGIAPEGLGGQQYGPIGYYTGRPDLNPPDVTAWGVARGFPRKHVPEATAVLTVWE